MKCFKWPDSSALQETLSAFVGRTMYLVDFSYRREVARGNNGDTLIDYAFRQLLDAMAITLTGDPYQADFLGVRPGGALLERYRAPSLLKRRLLDLPDLDLVIFPHSSWFPTEDPAQIFLGRRAPTLWILRDRVSYDHLSADWGATLRDARVHLALDHDVVLSAHSNVRELLGRYISASKMKASLLVPRLGVEAEDMLSAPGTLPGEKSGWDLHIRRAARLGSDRLPRPLRIALRRGLTYTRQRAADERLLTQLTDAGITFKREPRGLDISDPGLCSYESFLCRVANADQVFTNRLHVGIPAALLGASTYFVDSGYHKLRGVYLHSLAKAPNVHLLSGRP